MKFFLRFSLGYFCIALLIILSTRSTGLEPLYSALRQGVLLTPGLAKAIGVAVALVLAFSMFIQDRNQIRETLTLLTFAAVATIMFHVSFTLVKTSLPYILPFFADPFWAGIDEALHGGTAPWILAHEIAALLPFDMKEAFPFYLEYWTIPAVYLPALMAALDRDQVRIHRIMTLYLIVWVLLGNIMALAGMSAGPVYYDRLLGGETFSNLSHTLATSGISDTLIGYIQDGLWQLYVENEQVFGAGISAFPSVHVGIIMVGAIYLWERSRLLLPIGLAYVVLILFLSVYTGYHYAIDGYVSILVVFLAWQFLLRRDRRAESKQC
ncbi:MAG: hypothetical protein GY945_12130 [Rhodobacteraceae bacterium]|nr:hypothetical protein [Paracoccaceae bacterium]